jgi:hypothetical protein
MSQNQNRHVIVPRNGDVENNLGQSYQTYGENEENSCIENACCCLPEFNTSCNMSCCENSCMENIESYLSEEIDSDKMCYYGWYSFAFLCICVIIIATVTKSYYYVSYDQYALKRNKYHGVQLEKVYTEGRYFTTLDNDFVFFPATYKPIKFTSKTFSGNGLEFDLDISFYYKLPKEEIGSIYNLYSTNYASRIENNAKQVTKNIASTFSVDQFLQNRTYIEKTIGIELEKQIKNISNIDAPQEYFKIINIVFPTILIDKSLETAIALQNNEIAIKQQNVNIINADTKQMVSEITAEKNRYYAYAQTEGNKIISNANSQATNVILVAKSNGLDLLCNELNITSSSDKNRINKIFTIIDNANNLTLLNTGNNIIISP